MSNLAILIPTGLNGPFHVGDWHRARKTGRVVLTSGSFDLLHAGHVKYLEAARALGEILIVGVDSDAKIRARKGEGRPLVPEDERVTLLRFQRPIDYVYVKAHDEPKWGLIKAVRPDVLVLSEDHSYTIEELLELRMWCGEVVVLPRQARVTTSERIRQMHMDMGQKLGPALAEVLPGLIDDILKR